MSRYSPTPRGSATDKHTRPLGGLAALLTAVALAAVPLAADPSNRQEPIASEQVAGTILSVTPQTAYERAVLRVSGPNGYALTKRIPAGDPIAVNLLTEAEASEGANARDRLILPDGRYRYEVVFTDSSGGRRVHTGMFFVEGGSAVTRGAKQAALGAIREDLAATADNPDLIAAEGEVGAEELVVADRVLIYDETLFSNTELYLESSNYEDWSFVNQYGDLRIVEDGVYSAEMVIEPGGRVGIGTTAPAQELHIVSTDGADLRLSGSGADWGLGINAATNHITLYDATTTATVLLIEQGAPSNSLVIGTDGRVGLGTASPAADLDVRGHLRGTTFQSASSREIKTGFQAVDSAEILAKLRELPVTSWRYKDEGEDGIHIGPVAEDFQRLFGLGDGETLSTVDVDGVALAAIQGLAAENRALRQRLEEIEKRLPPTSQDTQSTRR